jgi:protein-tyrosine-phosphatase
MTADQYLRNVLAQYQVNTAAAQTMAQQHIAPVVQQWAGQYLKGIELSGSVAKGTANAGTNDMDLFISMSSTTPGTLKDIYESLYDLAATRWPTRRQNVSIGIQLAGLHFDLVPGRMQDGYRNWFSLWRNKAQTWTQTNIALQIQTVAQSGRTDEIRVLKRWRTLAGLDFPSFVLELAVLKALHGRRLGDLANNVSVALEWLRDNMRTAQLVDPANSNNLVSDDLSGKDRMAIAAAAGAARAQPYFSKIRLVTVMTIDLRQLFAARQQQLAVQLRLARNNIGHPVDKGTVSETEWLQLLRGFVPGRYCVDKATVIDSRGETSESIDLVVYDRHHSPLVFEQQGFRYIPAEAVYAIFEVKQSLNAEHVIYAARKAASVRRLHRTSVSVTDIHGTTPVKPPIHILAGLLTTEIEWSPASVTVQLRKQVEGLDDLHTLDLVCAADSHAFEISRDERGNQLQTSALDTGLVFFLFSFLQRLQQLGTVAPINFAAYKSVL